MGEGQEGPGSHASVSPCAVPSFPLQGHPQSVSPPSLQAAPHGQGDSALWSPTSSHWSCGWPRGMEQCSVPLSTSQGPACPTLHTQRLSQNSQSTFLPMVPHCLHPSLTNEDGFIPVQDKDIDLVCKRTFIYKLRPQKQKLPLPDPCHSHRIILQTS